MCLKSAFKVGMVNNIGDHPALSLLKQGHPVCICTDDSLVFRTTLTNECLIAYNLLNYTSIEEMELLQRNSFDYRFL
jgi:adenosine deaminase